MSCVSSFRSAVSCAAPGQDPCPVDCGKRLLLRHVCCAGLLMGMTTEHPLSKSKVTWNRFADATNSGGNDQTIVVLCLGHGEAVGGKVTVFSFLEKRKCFDFVFRFGHLSAKCGKEGWMRHPGTNSLTVSQNPTSHVVDGKRRRLELWTTSSSQRSSGQLYRERALTRSQTGTCPPCRSLPCPRADYSLTPSPFACSSCADSTFPSLCSHASVDVAVHSILVATIGPPVLLQGFSGEGVTPLPGFAARPHQCHGPGHGSSACSRLQKTRSCCRWSVSLIDTTLLAVLKRDGTPRNGVDRTNGVALASARQRKERTYQVRGAGPHWWCRSWRPLVQRGARLLGRIGCPEGSGSSFPA